MTRDKIISVDAVFSLTARVEVLEDALQGAIDFISKDEDVVDGPDGIPLPNQAMRLVTELRSVLRGAS